ncbi:MAG: ATP-binding protein [bacterium]
MGFAGQYALSGIFLLISILLFAVLSKMSQQLVELIHQVDQTLEYKNQFEDLNRKILEKSSALTEKIAESNIQSRITQAMISTMDLSKVLAVILEAVMKIARHDRAVLFLLNDSGSSLDAKQSVGFSSGKVVNFHLPMNAQGNPFYQTMQEARPVIIGEAEKYRSELYALADEHDEFPGELIANPLIAKDKVVGLIVVDHLKTKRKFEEEDLRNLLAYTQLAGMAVLNARLFQTEQNFHKELSVEVEKARNALLDAQELLIQSERLAALGEMAAVVAHEVKNPLASIRACAQSIDKSIQKGEKFDIKYLNYIHKEIDRLDNIVRSILMYSRPAKPKLLPFDLNIVVDETLDFMKKEIQAEKINLEKIFEPHSIKVNIDPEHTRQVLMNLVNNSIHFLKDKKIKNLIVKTAVVNTTAVLSVEDTGGGIDPKIVNKIFEPFFTTKTQGTGLGLAICYKIVKAENAEINLHNNPGKGIRLDIVFPLIKQS